MKNHKNDPRISAYILNELNPKDRISFEQELLQNSELSHQLDAYRKNISEVQNHFKNEPELQLSSDRKEVLFQKMKDSQKSPFAIPLGWAGGGFIAASLAFILFNHSLKNEAVRPMVQTEIAEADLNVPKMKMADEKLETVRIETHAESKGTARLMEQNQMLEKNKESVPAAPATVVAKEDSVADATVKLGAAAEGLVHSRGSMEGFGSATGGSAPVTVAAKPAASAYVASKKSLRESEALPDPTEHLIITVHPSIADSLKGPAVSAIKSCLNIDSNLDQSQLDLEFTWVKTSQSISIKKTNLMIDEKVLECLKSRLQKLPWSEALEFVISIHSVSN